MSDKLAAYKSSVLIDALVDETVKHVPGSKRLDDISGSRYGDISIDIEMSVPADDLLGECSDTALMEEVAERGMDEPSAVGWIVEAIAYIRAGDLSLATAMFARVFEDAELAQIESALR